MIIEAGHFALILALAIAFVQGVLPLVGAARGDGRMMAVARPAAVAQFALIAVSFACLTYAYVTSDFSVVNVIANSHSMKPMLYKVTGVWANHEGSMLLWVMILAAFGSAVAIFGRNLPPRLRARVLGIQAWVAIGFYLFILFTSNPFERAIPAPLDGRGLNPLLQDPGLAFHPPFLYLGYVGFSIAFSFAIAALIEGRVDATWARWVRPWTLAAWSFLTIGIGLGSWWAYYELGWGGWWFWDPVENASFMPWLAGTALLHSAVVVEKRNTLKGWTIFLAIITFSLSLLGTFIVRSGVLTSVHSFAADPERGLFILVILILVTGGSLTLFAWRGPSLKAGGLFQPVSREGALLLNNLLMTTGAAVVLLGTLYPLFLDAVGGGKISVGPPFFNMTFIPLMVPVVLAMAVAPFMGWKRGDLTAAFGRMKAAFALAAATIVLTWWMRTDGPILAALGMGAAAWLVVGAVVEVTDRIRLFRSPLEESLRRLRRIPLSSWGMTIAHGGLGITVAAMVAAGAWKIESIQSMSPGNTVTVAGYDYTFEGARQIQGPNYTATRARLTVRKDGSLIANMEPEHRVYTVQNRPTTEAAIHSTLWADLYVAIGDPRDSPDNMVVRIFHNPLIAWLWTGLLVMVLGSGVSLLDRRHRIGAPVRHGKQDGKQPGAPAPATTVAS